MKRTQAILQRALIISVFFAVIFPALAFAKKDATCKDCKILAGLTQKMSKLSPQKEEDRMKGLDLILIAQDIFVKADEAKDISKTSPELFKEMILFTREAALFDDESQLVGFVGDWTQAHKNLKVQYDDLLKSMKKKPALEACKTERLALGVEENACLAKSKMGPKDQGISAGERATEKCLKPFALDACLKKNK